MSKRQVSIGVALRAAIQAAKRQGVTRAAIAKRTGMPRSQVTRIATGESVPLLDTAERVAKAIGYRLALVAM